MSQDDDEDEESPQFIALADHILRLLEERYDWGEGDVPEAWWDPPVFIRDNPQLNYTDDEIYRASEVAIRMFYEDQPEALDDAYHRPQFFIEEIIDDVIDSVTSIIFGGVPGGPGHGRTSISVFSHLTMSDAT